MSFFVWRKNPNAVLAANGSPVDVKRKKSLELEYPGPEATALRPIH
jgi:hypothetical protein